MQESWWISIIGNQTTADITKLWYNLHLYVVWLLLKKKFELLLDIQKERGQTGSKDIWIEWNPIVLWSIEKYYEITGTVRNLIRFEILKEVKFDFVTHTGKDDDLTVFHSCTLNNEILEDEDFDGFPFGYYVRHPKLSLIRMSILVDDDKSKHFVDKCLQAWEKWDTRHFKYDFIAPRKQRDIVLEKLKEKFKMYGNQKVIFDSSEIPNEVDTFSVLLSLEQDWIIQLYHTRKKIEIENSIPKTFFISILKPIVDENWLIDWTDKEIWFNQANWFVYINWKEIWRIKVWNKEYDLFNLLYSNLDKPFTFDEMKKEFKIWQTGKTSVNFFSWIKDKLDLPIRKLIGNIKWGYILYSNGYKD